MRITKNENVVLELIFMFISLWELNLGGLCKLCQVIISSSNELMIDYRIHLHGL
jgi:hypothetical protein